MAMESKRRRIMEDEEESSVVSMSQKNESQDFGFALSQQVPEASQSVQPARQAERRNLDTMDPHERDRALTKLSRLLLFKALNQEPIDRLKTIKDAGLGDAKVSSAAYQEVASRFINVFGFELKQTPAFMTNYKFLPARFRERYYLINTIQDTDDGSHSKAIHSVDDRAKVEKGLLLLIVALIYCKGQCRADTSRHLLARDLYMLMNKVDENIPAHPPVQGTARSKFTASHKSHRFQQTGNASILTPNLDAMLEHFVAADYLLREKALEEHLLNNEIVLEEGDVWYTMGPRAALELGRKQILFFCAEVLGEEPDPTMLQAMEQEEVDDNFVAPGV
eukprot:Nitzschia sp. Nitz4//scaffold126_size65214//18056//19060//NITZ4_006149-RA/size65214-processed-gene-0.36-mRNA-1//-1//CDS//3329534668//7422//frame0